MFKLRIYLLVFTLLLGSICNAASFDCKKARSYSEKLICSEPALSMADDLLAEQYKKNKKATKNSKEFRALVKKNWLEREKCQTEQCVAEWYINVSRQYQEIAEKISKEKSRLQPQVSKKEEPSQNVLRLCWAQTIVDLDDSKIEADKLAKVVVSMCRNHAFEEMKKHDVIRNLPPAYKLKLFQSATPDFENEVTAMILVKRKSLSNQNELRKEVKPRGEEIVYF